MKKITIGIKTYAGETYPELYHTLIAHGVLTEKKPLTQNGYEDLIKVDGGLNVQEIKNT